MKSYDVTTPRDFLWASGYNVVIDGSVLTAKELLYLTELHFKSAKAYYKLLYKCCKFDESTSFKKWCEQTKMRDINFILFRILESIMDGDLLRIKILCFKCKKEIWHNIVMSELLEINKVDRSEVSDTITFINQSNMVKTDIRFTEPTVAKIIKMHDKQKTYDRLCQGTTTEWELQYRYLLAVYTDLTDIAIAKIIKSIDTAEITTRLELLFPEIYSFTITGVTCNMCPKVKNAVKIDNIGETLIFQFVHNREKERV